MSLKAIIENLLDEERGEIDEASDINKDWHHDLIAAWRSEASVEDCYEVFTNPATAKAESLLMEISADMPNALITGSTELQRLMAEYWWIQIGWYVDKAILEVRAEHELTALIAREERAEQQAEWQRDRALSKEAV